MEVFFLMMGLWLVVAVALGMRRPRGFGGAVLRQRLDAVYGEPHELVRVMPAAFPEADLEFYDRARTDLEAKGYRWLADVEDLTMSRIYPQNRTFLRLFVDAGGMIRASAYHLHPRGVVVSLLQLVQLFPRHLRVVELVSEVQGTFVVTSNTHGVDRLEPPPEARVERMPLATPILEIIATHEGRIRELLRKHPERSPVTFETFEDVLASMARAHVAMARHRQRVGGLSRDELERLKGRPLSATEEAFLREVQGKPE
ncbi:MAG: hypothetical protein KF773_23260 [Deltaproteobacteria bacterium]|nr:hypothetical protein [Deltaproteobacteria bacterium]MCW5808938.1 hypothetical protein [Deltaproteobacteria bacterium]